MDDLTKEQERQLHNAVRNIEAHKRSASSSNALLCGKAESYKKLYTLTNELMAQVGADGEITFDAQCAFADKCMSALFEIDGGTPDDDKYGNSDT